MIKPYSTIRYLSSFEVHTKEDFISAWSHFISLHQGKKTIIQGKYATKMNATFIKKNLWRIESEFPNFSDGTIDHSSNLKSLKLTTHIPFFSTDDVDIRKKRGMDGLTLKTYKKLEDLGNGYACIGAKPHSYKLHYLIPLLQKSILDKTFKKLSYKAESGILTVDFRCSYLPPEYLNNMITLLSL